MEYANKFDIIVTIPFNKLSAEINASNSHKGNAPVNALVDAPVGVPDHNDKAALLLKYCQEPKKGAVALEIKKSQT